MKVTDTPVFLATKVSAFDDDFKLKTIVIYLDGSFELCNSSEQEIPKAEANCVQADAQRLVSGEHNTGEDIQKKCTCEDKSIYVIRAGNNIKECGRCGGVL